MKKLTNKYKTLKTKQNDYLIKKNRINYYKKKRFIYINNDNKGITVNVDKIIYYTENLLFLEGNNSIEITIETYKYLNEIFDITFI